MKKILIFLGITLMNYYCLAQDPSFIWVKGFGGPSYDGAYTLGSDINGNVYITGYFRDSMDADPGPGVQMLYDPGGCCSEIFIIKLDSSGIYQWSKKIGSTGTDDAYGMAVDAQGNVYLTGRCEGNVDLDPGPGVQMSGGFGSWDFFILKLNTSGNFVWGHSMGSSGTDYGYDVSFDQQGKLLVLGTMEGIIDFDPGPAVAMLGYGSQSTFLLKMDTAGNYIWGLAYLAIGDAPYKCKTDSQNNIYITGTMQAYTDFDPGPATYNLNSNGSWDIFIQKLDPSGNFIWAKTFGALYQDESMDMCIDPHGNIYMTGFFNLSVDFDPGLASTMLTAPSGYANGFLLSLDATGNFRWLNPFSSNFTTSGRCIRATQNGHILIGGNFSDSVDFDPGPNVHSLQASSNSWDIFVASYDTSGNFDWVNSINGYDEESIYNMCFTEGEALLLTGRTWCTADYNFGIDTAFLPFPVLNNTSDVFITKWGWCDSSFVNNINITACDSFSMAGQTSYTSGLYNLLVPNCCGCLVHTNLNLIVNLADSSIHNLNGCQQIVFNGQTYNTSGNYSQIISTTAGCDSTLILHLQIEHPDTNVSVSGATLQANAGGAIYQWLDCNNAFMPISGATSQTYIALSNGSYALSITQNTCTDTSACHIISVLNLHEVLSSDMIQIIPNPGHGEYTVVCNACTDHMELNLYDVFGKVIWQRKMNSTSDFKIQINEGAGIYWLRCIMNNKVYQVKILKE